GLVAEIDLQEALAVKRRHQDRRLGEILVQRGRLSRSGLASALAEQHGLSLEAQLLAAEPGGVGTPSATPSYRVCLVGYKAREESAGRGGYCKFEGEPRFSQLGIQLRALGPGEPMSMYHWEADQEDFLVLSGEALLIIEGEERPLLAWDFVHCPPEAKHTIVGANEGCLCL